MLHELAGCQTMHKFILSGCLPAWHTTGDEGQPAKKKVVYASKKKGPRKQPSGDAGAAAEAEAAKQAEAEAVALAAQQAKVRNF